MYVIVRGSDAGVFAGEMDGELDGTPRTTVVLREARRIWYWSGAASLSELANEGPGNPGKCKFPAPVALAQIEGVCEILSVTSRAKAAITAVPTWTAR